MRSTSEISASIMLKTSDNLIKNVNKKDWGRLTTIYKCSTFSSQLSLPSVYISDDILVGKTKLK